MCRMGIPEHHLTEGERVVHSFHPHWKRLVRPVLAVVILLAALVTAFLLIPGGEPYTGYARIAVTAVVVILLVWWALVPYLRWVTTSYTLTTHRFSISTGILNKSQDDIPLAKVSSVSSDQRLLERILGCGTLVVESASDTGDLRLTDVPRIQLVRSELFRLVEDAADGQVDGR
ncbi:PH (Pleckstrin Homology) domain-containing protein [Thermopolyspora flexuosa]|uniref:PH (Pleckstrin Homology) domain-containing protein n=2 Tax=Thermopolyspora flexuosa TaxID=103836 RepID=A0A543J243_9ACTN|nr:PH (Pleckstrin Homology) domain-containing protein [Thermopolyspora flexuosa]